MTTIGSRAGRKKGTRGTRVQCTDLESGKVATFTVHGAGPKQLREEMLFWLRAVQEAEAAGETVAIVRIPRREKNGKRN